MRVPLFVLLLSVALGAEARTVLLDHIPLQWKPTSSVQLPPMEMPKTPIQFETFQDEREGKEAIGENREDEKKPKPVTTSDDVGRFVSTHMRELFVHSGLNVVDSDAAVTIKGEVRRFFVAETGTYQGELAVHITVVGRDGKTLWSGVASGDASRFGRSYKAENYYETLSDSLVNSVSSMLQSAEFQKAVAGI
jgi:hypothetical protein